MADVNDLISRAQDAIQKFYGAKSVVEGHDEAVADLQRQIDSLNAAYPEKVAEVAAAREQVKAVFEEIIGAN